MAFPKKIAPIFAFLLSGNILIGIGPASVYAAEKTMWEKASEQVVRLPPSAFPQLPEPIRNDLDDRGCSVPQPVGPGSTLQPENENHNVISGEFQKPGQTDWAVLCSIEGSSVVLVFWNGSADNVEQLGDFSLDKRWLQGIGTDRKTLEPLIGYSRGIYAVDKDYILRDREGGPRPPPVDHEGIEEAFIGKVSWIQYWYEGEWLGLGGAD